MILDRYLRREVLRAFAACMLLLAAIFASTTTVRYLADAASGKIAGEVIAALLVLKLGTASLVLVPLCFFLGILIAYGRMRQDNELVAMAGAGYGAGRLQAQTARMALGCAAAVALLSFVLEPMAERELDDLEARAADEANVSGIVPGRFKEYDGGDRVLFVERVADEHRRMQQVFLRVRDHDRDGVIRADNAGLADDPRTGERFVVFGNGRRYLGKPGTSDYSITEFERYGVRLSGGGASDEVHLGAMPTHELWVVGTPHALSNLHYRLAMPISVLLLAAAAAALVRWRALEGRFTLILAGILLYFLYNNLLGIFRSLVRRETIGTIIGLWPVHLFFAVLVLALEFGPGLLRTRTLPVRRKLRRRH
ncbi:MAG: LPS export ABC transporter permease LptF [Gammaproteobacteria bacterium]